MSRTQGEAGRPGEVDAAAGRSRRSFFGLTGTALGAAAMAGAGGWALGRSGASTQDSAQGGGSSSPLAPTDGVAPPPENQRVEGITWPQVPQRHQRLSVLTLEGGAASSGAAAEGARGLLAAVRAEDFGSAEDGGIVTVTLGFGATLARAAWPERAGEDQNMPAFRYDTKDTSRGGDVSVQVCAESGAAALTATARVLDLMGEHLGSASTLWAASGYRDAPTPHGTTRTSTGFVDGIINPRSDEELGEGVWTGKTAAAPRDCYVAYRRMTVSTDFAALPVDEQEAAVGRRRSDGAPLSGGSPLDQVDLFAKTDSGTLLTPLRSHARRAHPSNLGLSLMLRRSYAFDPEGAGMGLVFVAFMARPSTFVRTQQRLDDEDDFLKHSTADAAGLFFVPGPA